MNYQLITTICTLIALIITIISVFAKLSNTMGKLEISIDLLNKTLDEFKSDENANREKIIKTLESHEKRLSYLEFISEKKGGKTS